MERAILPSIFGQDLGLPRGSDADLPALSSGMPSPDAVLGPVDTGFAVVELDNLAALEARLEPAELLAALHVLHVLVQALCDKHQVQMVSFGIWRTCAWMLVQRKGRLVLIATSSRNHVLLCFFLFLADSPRRSRARRTHSSSAARQPQAPHQSHQGRT
jgi:hypothetical protein